MAGEIEAYQDASSALQQHQTSMQQVFDTIRAFSAMLNNWKRIVIPNVSMPAEVCGPGSTSFNPGSWPTGEQISKMLLTWHELRSRQRSAWEKVPQERRMNLAPPT